MSFCIMRMAKLKSKRDVVMSLQHNTRERVPPNASREKAGLNFIFGGTTAETMNRYDGLMPDNIRANAVHAVELVMTASPEMQANWQSYLKACDKWAMNLFGAENLLHVAHHYDESTPHTHVLVVPKKDGKLNANFFIGGSKNRMAELQEDFYQKVGKEFDLERGISKSETKARHTPHTLAGKTAELDQREENIKLREKVLSEHEKQFADFQTQFKKIYKISPDEVLKLKTQVENWDRTTAAGLRTVAANIERSGAANVGEYRKVHEAQRSQEQSRRSSSFKP